MTKLLISFLVLILLPHSLANAGEGESQTVGATIVGLHMMEGDKVEWSSPGFDSSAWPMNRSVANSSFNRVMKPEAIGWLRTKPFSLPSSFRDSPMALYVISGASFEVFWNGVKIGENGRPANNAEAERDGLADTRFYIPPDAFLAEGNVLAVRYSAHGYSRLHLPLAFSFNIGVYQNASYQRLVNYVPAMLLIGAVGVAALFFGALFIRRRADRGSLWLAIMFLMVVLQATAETSRAIVSYSYLGQVARIAIIFLAAYGSGLFLNLFVLTYLDTRNLSRWVIGVTHTAAIVAIALYFNHFDKLSYAFLIIFIASALALTGYGVVRKKRGARSLFFALLVFGASFLVGYTDFLDSYYYASMALLAGTLFVLQATAFRDAEQLLSETKLKINRLELDLLKRQIQPHFIMNTLTALSEWILTSPENSVDMIDALAEEFRILNTFVGKKLVPLESELDLCRSHLKLMSYRQDQTFWLEVTLDTTGLLVPPAIFHTLIENALSHARYSGDNTVFHFKQQSIGATATEFVLTAPLGTKSKNMALAKKGSGMGLSYIKARLEESWGEDFALEYGEDSNGRWQTIIVVQRGAVH